MVVLHTPDGLIEQHEGFLSLPLPPDERAGRDELAWQRDRMEWRDVKQADVVMLMSLLEPQFTPEQRLGNYRLYEPLTRHLSSLSEAVHSVVARRLGLHTEADDYLRRAIAIDLDDSRDNRASGLHMATQGGLWQAVAIGCAGVRAGETALEIDPHLPPGWTRLRFRIAYRGVPLHPHADARRDRDRGAHGRRPHPHRRARGRGARRGDRRCGLGPRQCARRLARRPALRLAVSAGELGVPDRHPDFTDC